MDQSMMQAIQLRGHLAPSKRRAKATSAVNQVVKAIEEGSDAELDRADGLLVSVVHAGVRPTELFLAIVEAAITEEK
jgi:hypothetical protein